MPAGVHELEDNAAIEHLGLEGVDLADHVAYKANSMSHQKGGDCVRVYEDWALAGNYEQMLNRNVYRGPSIVAAALVHCLLQSTAVLVAHEIHILDVAAGTGLVAKHLVKHGFHNIDALDPSKEMLKIARTKGIYRNFYNVLVPDISRTISNDTYDCVLSSGGMGEGHIPLSGLDDIIRMTKHGGLIIVVMRSEYLEYVEEYRNKLRPKLRNLVEDGVITPVDPENEIGEKRVSNYSFNKQGSVFSFFKI